MKNFFLTFVILLSFNSLAQFEDIFASDSDAVKFVSDFTRPAFKGLMYASNAAWVTSAKPLKSFHIELNISASGAFVSREQETFTFNQADYQYLQIESGPNVLPTIMGDKSQTTIKIVIPDNNNNQYKLLEFDAPDGIKKRLPVNAVPAPMAQLSMGLPLGSEVNLRYTPKLTNEDGGFFQILGLGFKHSLSQYFPKNAMMNKSVNTDIEDILKRGCVPLDVETFKSMAEHKEALVLDCRSRIEFAEGHVPGALFIGLDGQFAPWVGALIENIKQPIILVAPFGREEEALTPLKSIVVVFGSAPFSKIIIFICKCLATSIAIA